MGNIVSMILAGCSIAAVLGKQSDGGKEVEMLAEMQFAAQHVMADHMYLDMDHDGAQEMIGAYLDEDYHCHTWYCGSDGKTCEPVYTSTYAYIGSCTIEALDIGKETHVVINNWNWIGPGKSYTILALRDRKMERLIADQYGYVWMTDKGDILLDIEEYDAELDPDDEGGIMIGHTWKDTYLFYEDGVYKEYAATEIPEAEFLTYRNAETLKEKIAKELKKPDTVSLTYSYFRRSNGILHIQCDVKNEYGTIAFGYYTVRYEGNVLEAEPGNYNSGRMRAGGFSELEKVY